MNYQEEGEITSVIRTNGSECEQTSEPAITYFQTAEGKQLRSHEGGISLTAKDEEDKQIKLLLQDEGGILLRSEKVLQLIAKEGIEMHAPLIRFRGANLFNAELASTGKGFSIENEINLLESRVNIMGSPMSFPAMEQPKTPEAKPKKKSLWGKIFKVAIAAVAVVAVAAVIVAAMRVELKS